MIRLIFNLFTFFAGYGVPEIFNTDQGRKFTSSFLQAIYLILNKKNKYEYGWSWKSKG